MPAVEVAHVGVAVAGLAADGVVEGQEGVGVEGPALVEADGDAVGGQHVQVDGLAAGPVPRRQVAQQAVQQQRGWRHTQQVGRLSPLAPAPTGRLGTHTTHTGACAR